MRAGIRSWLSALRVHYWIKNLLLFVPLIAGHSFGATEWRRCCVAFILFCVLSSSIYLLNDVADRPKDALHPTKKNRPIASGKISVSSARTVAALGMGGVFLGGWQALGVWTALYFVSYAALSWAYTHQFKKQRYLDLFALSLLYLLRVEVGSSSTGIVLSHSLILFSFFLFLGLAALKRVAELKVFSDDAVLASLGRPYRMSQLKILVTSGWIASGLSSIVLVKYILDPEIQGFYVRPLYLWGVVLGMSGWWLRIWGTLFQGEWSHDPVEFVCRDKRGWFWILFSAVFFLQALGGSSQLFSF